MANPWRKLPPIARPAPVIALLARPDGVWAGGAGGLARFREPEGWSLPVAGLPLQAVATLAAGDGTIMAGGAGGIARSLDGGATWWRSSIPEGTGPVTALALSPRFALDGMALAGTLGGGVLRSTDGGRTWHSSSFGLSSPEVMALAWGSGETVVAATAHGLDQSPNAGRAWRSIAATAGTAFTALATLPDGPLMAAPDTGPLLHSTSDFTRWEPLGGLPDDVRISTMLALARSILAGSADHGLLRSSGDGSVWQTVSQESVLCFASHEGRLYAGTSSGVMASDDDGETWRALPPPPLCDLQRIAIVDGRPLLFGAHSAPLRLDEGDRWAELHDVPSPLTGLFAAPDGALLAATAEALFRSEDGGHTWRSLGSNSGGIAQMTFASRQRGWAGATADGAMLRTVDGGRNWTRRPSPFGVLPLIALQAIPSQDAGVIGATYDERKRSVTFWRSDDGGEHWARGADSPAPWPVVATAASPPVVTVGNVVTIRQPNGEWRRATVGDSAIRRVASDGATIFALALDELWRSDDLGASWRRDDADLPVSEVVDIAVTADDFYALLRGGRLWTRPLSSSDI